MNNQSLTIKAIASIIHADIQGNENTEITGFAGIDVANAKDICFLSNKKYEKYLLTTNAGCVIVDKNTNKDFLAKARCTLLLANNAYEAFATLLQEYQKMNTIKKEGISQNCSVGKNVTLRENIYIGDYTCIGKNSSIGEGCQLYSQVFIGENVSIGENCIIYPGVKIMNGSQIGDRVIIHSNAVIGSDGFGFAPLEDGSYIKIPQIGIAVLEDDVEVGANTAIDRATTGKTIISKGTKLDNLIQIAHNVKVGKHCVIAAQTGISGSTSVGNHCSMGGQVGIVGHLNIGNRVQIGAQAGVTHSKDDNARIVGYPAIEIKDFGRILGYQKRLGDMYNRIQSLENKLKEIKAKE